MEKLVINYAPTGMLMQKKDTPFIPLSTEEIINDVREAVKLGITSVHLHARNKDGSPSWEKGFFEDIILGIREFAPNLVISVTTSGRVYNTFEKRSDVLDLDGRAKPDMASLTLSSLNFNKTASVNEPNMIVSLLQKMNDKNIKPELEAFDNGMINYSKYLIKKELLKPPYYYNLIIGNIACAQPTLLHTGVMVNDLPEDSIVSFGGIGKAQMKINAMAVSMGFGVRVGLEDNIWFDDNRTRLATNIDLLKRVHVIADAVGRPICTSEEFRSLCSLPL